MKKDHEEEHIFHNVGKEARKHKKLVSSKDRSKFKKTDKSKREAQLQQEAERRIAKKDLARGRVLFISPEAILCDVDGKLMSCVLRGSLKKEKGKVKNLIVIGDFVLIEQAGENEGAICFVEKRYSTLSRASHFHRSKQQLIAANIDQVLITASCMNPPLKPALIDRYIIASIKGGMEPVVLINKIDLIEKGEEAFLREFIETYTSLGFKVIPLSFKKGVGLDDLQEVMRGKASVFSGQSGTGKTSLINAVTGLSLKTGEVVKKTLKGAHTTTAPELIPLAFGGFCIDTPGIRSFGVWDLKYEDIQRYFPEISAASQNCKYPNCTHTHEPGCSLKELVADGTISPLRLQSYQKLLTEL